MPVRGYKKKPYKKGGYMKKGKKNYKKKKYSTVQSLTVRGPATVVPDRLFTKLMYTDQTSTTLAAAGTSFGYIRYQWNSLFDINPLILTSNVVGKTELSNLYERYRVRGAKIEILACNQEAFPVNIVLWPTTIDQASSMTYAYAQSMLSNAYARYATLSSRGGMDRCRLTGYISTKKLAGSKYTEVDDDYQALTNFNPVNLCFWNISAYSLTQSNFTTASVPFECRITVYAEFFDRRQITQ